MPDPVAIPIPEQGPHSQAASGPALSGRDGVSDAGASNAGLPIHDLADLLRGGTEALIRHDGQLYSLRVTRANKLLLTK